MKFRTLTILLATAALLAGLAAWVARRPAAGPAPETGRRALSTPDINAVARIGIASGTQRVELARGPDGWTVASLWDYPARFESVADLLRGLDGLRVAEVIRGGADLLAEFGLDDQSTNPPARITLTGAEGGPPEEIALGQPRVSPAIAAGFSMPDGRFVRVGGGPVVLAEPFLDDIPRRAADWIRKKLFDLPAASVREIAATPAQAPAYGIERTASGGYAGVRALGGRPINSSGADLWFRALQGLTALGVADPALPRESLGFGRGDVAIARATNGLTVRIELGDPAGDDGRHGWLSFQYEEPPPAPSGGAEADAAGAAARAAIRAEVEDLQKRLAPWTHVFSAQTASALIFPRDQLVASETAPGTNTVSGDVP